MKKKGFTLVEVLTVIVILGLLSTIAILSINKYIKSSHQKYYDKQLELFKIAGQSYFTDHKSELPTINLSTNRVYLKTLIAENYINKIVDHNKKTCNSNDSFVQVQKKSTGKYVYSAYLKCDNKTVGSINNNNEIGQFGFELKYNNGAETEESLGDVHHIESYVYKYYTNNQVSFNLTITAKNSEILTGYRYRIYKNSKMVKESENIYIDSSNKIDDIITIDQSNFTDGEYTIGVVPINSNGKTFTDYHKFSDFIIIIDTKKPTCNIELPATSKKVNGWYNANSGNAKITINDVYLNGYYVSNSDSIPTYFNLVQKSNYTQAIELNNTTAEGQKFYGYAKDKAGNIGKCKTDIVKVDKNAPKCEINVQGTKNNDNTWYITNPNIYLNNNNITDIGESGIDSYGIGTLEGNSKDIYNNISSTTQGETKAIIWYGIIKDKAGNINTCNSSIMKVDTLAPSCISAGGSSSWVNTDITITGTCRDDISECKNHAILSLSDGNGVYSPGIVEDNAGHQTVCQEREVHIDKIPPDCPTAWNEDEPEAREKFVSDVIMLNPTIPDDRGGSSIRYMDWSTYYADASKNKVLTKMDYNHLFLQGYANLEEDGANVYATLKIYDWADNTSSCQTPYYKIDMTKPYFNVLSDDKHSNGFYNGGNYNKMPRTVYCNDDLSGVNLKTFETDLIKNGDFKPGEGTENKVNSLRLINNNKAEMKYVYDANGRKHTKFICSDNAGNTNESYIDDSEICCRCRAAKDMGCTTSNGTTTCKFYEGDKVYNEDDIQSNGNLYFCDNEHTVKGVTFNAGIHDRTGTDMYLSCAKCS